MRPHSSQLFCHVRRLASLSQFYWFYLVVTIFWSDLKPIQEEEEIGQPASVTNVTYEQSEELQLPPIIPDEKKEG